MNRATQGTGQGTGQAQALPGSWEALYAEGAALSRQGNDTALEKFTYLVGRLAKLPPARLSAHDGRLQSIFEQSVIGLQSHYARRNRLDDLRAGDDEVLKVLGDDALSLWNENAARAYWWQGMHEEAAQIVRFELDDLPFDIDLRWLLFSILIDCGKIEEADALRVALGEELELLFHGRGELDFNVDEVSRQFQVKERLESAGEKDLISIQFGLMHFQRSCVEMERGRWQEAADSFGTAAKLSDAYSERWHLLYRPLVVNRQVRLGQRALNREKAPVSQGFWRGLSGFYAGDRQGALVEWRRVAQIPLEEVTLPSVGDWILAHFYLDLVDPSTQVEAEQADAEEGDGGGLSAGLLSDDGRRGLQVALNLLGQPNTRRDPLVLGLAALGWGMNGNRDHLLRNLRHSLELLRATFQDNKLSVFNWYFFRDLLPAARFAELEQFFHRPKQGDGAEGGGGVPSTAA